MEAGCLGALRPTSEPLGMDTVQEGTHFQGEAPASWEDRPSLQWVELGRAAAVGPRGGLSHHRLGLWDRISPERWPWPGPS